jgi:hypothetical protein
MEDERQFRADYDLLSLDFRAPSQTSNHEGLYLAGKRFDALGFYLTRSSSTTASISATLMG